MNLSLRHRLPVDRRVFRRIVLAAFCISLFPVYGECQEKSALDVFGEFVAALKNSVPVTGTFVIETARDKETFAKIMERAEKQAAEQGRTVSGPIPTEETLRCRWSYDQNRELVETLDGSTAWQSFYLTQEHLLTGQAPGNFNIIAPKTVGVIRPASFYFNIGGTPWAEAAKNRTVSFGAAENTETVSLLIEGDHREIEILLEAQTYRLRKAVFKHDGQLLAEQRIERYLEGDRGQVFPEAATLTMYSRGKPIKTDRLTAVSVSFPSTPEETDAAFAMVMPEGTEIYDMLLEKKVQLARPTSVAEILALDGQGWSEMRIGEEMKPPDVGGPGGPQQGMWYQLIGLNLVVAIIVIGIIVWRRTRRTSAR